MVTIYVGKKRKRYTAHEDLLVSKCPYFAGCLRESFPESETNEVYLAEDRSEAFDILVTWIYREVVYQANCATGVGSLILAYMLADKFFVPSLKNDLVDEIRK